MFDSNGRYTGTGSTAMTRDDPLNGLRYYPVFALLVVVLFITLTLLTSAFVTHGFVDQVLVPRFHPVELRPGDVIEVGSSGKYRPVLVRHADGSTTDTGELHEALKHLRQFPSFLTTALVFFPTLWGLARIWPKTTPPPEPEVTPPP